MTETADRITVALIPKAARDLERLRQRQGMSKTDLVNRAITLYEFVDATLAAGGELLRRNPETGDVEKVHLL